MESAEWWGARWPMGGRYPHARMPLHAARSACAAVRHGAGGRVSSMGGPAPDPNHGEALRSGNAIHTRLHAGPLDRSVARHDVLRTPAHRTRHHGRMLPVVGGRTHLARPGGAGV